MKKLALITGTFLAALAFLLLAWQLRSVVGILFVAVMLATTMSGFVLILVNRGWSYRGARVTIIVGTLLFSVFFGTVTIYALGERLPEALKDFRAIYSEMRTALFNGNRAEVAIAMRMPHPVRLDDLIFGTDGSGLITIFSGISSNLGSAVSNVVLVIFVALYWVADRERIERLWLSLLSPAQRNYARNLLYQIEDVVGAHLRSQVVQYALALILLMVGYSLLGMRYPWLLAWIASIVWFVPLIGGFLALIPAFLLGLIDGYTTALAIVIYTALIFMVVPLVTQRFRSLRQQQGSILGLMITIALIDVMGLVGVAMALPVTVAIQALLAHLRSNTLPQAEDVSQLQLQPMLDKLATIHSKIREAEAPISPRTLSMFERLNQMVSAIDRE